MLTKAPAERKADGAETVAASTATVVAERGDSPAAQLLALQSSAGNQAVLRMLQRRGNGGVIRRQLDPAAALTPDAAATEAASAPAGSAPGASSNYGFESAPVTDDAGGAAGGAPPGYSEYKPAGDAPGGDASMEGGDGVSNYGFESAAATDDAVAATGGARPGYSEYKPAGDAPGGDASAEGPRVYDVPQERAASGGAGGGAVDAHEYFYRAGGGAQAAPASPEADGRDASVGARGAAVDARAYFYGAGSSERAAAPASPVAPVAPGPAASGPVPASSPMQAPAAAAGDNRVAAKYGATRARKAEYSEEFTEGSADVQGFQREASLWYDHAKGRHRTAVEHCPTCKKAGAGGAAPASTFPAAAAAAVVPTPEMEAREAQERRAVFVQYMQRSFRWTDDDCAKFIDKVRNIRDKTKSSEEKPTVTSLDEVARQQFEVVGSGSLTRNGDAFTTAGDFSNHSGGGWAIFVMSPNGNIYAGSHKVGLFHHSSFLAGGNVAGAGEVKASGGTISGLTNKSGHYRPTSAEMVQVFDELKSRGVSLSSVRYQHFTGTATNWVAGGAKGAYDSFKRDPNAVPPIEGAAPAAAAPAAAAPAAAATAG